MNWRHDFARGNRKKGEMLNSLLSLHFGEGETAQNPTFLPRKHIAAATVLDWYPALHWIVALVPKGYPPLTGDMS